MFNEEMVIGREECDKGIFVYFRFAVIDDGNRVRLSGVQFGL